MSRHQKDAPIAIDLFAGGGGLTEGLRQAGFRVIGAVENEPLACETYRLNHPQVVLWEDDIRNLTGTTIHTTLGIARGDLDLLAACPPCQGFSTMRTKNGRRSNRDSRNKLVFEVLRLTRSLRPKTLMLENVPGLTSDRGFHELCRGLTRCGYKIDWDILDASYFAVPQRRRRLILLASRVGTPKFANPAKCERTVRDAIGDLESPTKSKDELHTYSVVRSKEVENLIKRIPRNGGSRRALGHRNQLPCHRKIRGFWDVYGRMAWDGPSPTITGGCINPSKGRFLHPRANRAITLREAALLQTFPKGYRFSLKKGRYPVALLIGNALPPEFIRRHALALKKLILAKTTKLVGSH